MNRRVIGLFLVLLLLGLGAGYAWASATADEPATFGTAAPVPAASPEFPAGRLVVEEDPPDPPMPTGLPLVPDVKGNADFGVRLDVPEDWSRTDPSDTDAKWMPVGLSDAYNTYFMRTKLILSQNLTVAQARDARIQALREVTDDFRVERATDDTVTATYVSDNHRRLAMERFLSLDGTEDPGDRAWLTIVVVGRLGDREGLIDLLDRATASAVKRSELTSG